MSTFSERTAEPPKPPPPLPLVWLRDITPVLDAQDFVQGVLLAGGAVVVFGDSNAGKTFWFTDLALHVAAGLEWNGRRVLQGGVVYCILEGGNGFRNRVVAWREAHPDTDANDSFAAIPSSLNLLDATADVQRLIDAIKEAGREIGQPIKLVVIDTLSRALAGGDENGSEDMGALVRAMDRIRADTKACVVFIHHSGKDQAKGARGHSLLRAAIDTEIEVVEGGGDDGRTAFVVKQRDLPRGDTFRFTLQQAVVGQNEHGESVTTCIVEHGGTASESSDAVLTVDERGWFHDIAAFYDDPARVHEGVKPAPGSASIRGATRAEIRGWLVKRGRLGVAADVAGGAKLSATERSTLSRMINKLKDKGKIGVFDDWIWLK